MDCLKITWNRLKSVEIASNIIFFAFKKFEFFLVEDGISKSWKRKNWENILEHFAKEPIFKGKE